MKKGLAIILALSVIAAQLMLVFPVFAQNADGSGELIATFTSKSWNDSAKGFTITEQAVGDNYHFTSALQFTIADMDKFNVATDRNAAFYEMQGTAGSIGDWANNTDAEMRFYIRSQQDFSVTLSIMNAGNGGYPHIYLPLNITASDKWQEIRFQRSDFTSNATFDDSVTRTTGYTVFRFQTTADFLAAGETFEISPIEFYDGEIPEEVDPDGGTILPHEGELIAEFTAKSWNDSAKGFSITSELVADNTNFTSSLKFQIADLEKFNSATDRNAAFYELQGADGGIGSWATNESAELRFWIRSTQDFTASISLMNAGNGGYPHIYVPISIEASEKWQEIRLKRSDFTSNTTFDSNVQKTTGYTVFRIITTADFMDVGESFEISKVQFFDGYIGEALDPDGGTIIVIPEEGEKIAEFSNAGWNATNKGFTVSGEVVGDNSNFTNALKFEVTDTEAFNSSTDRNAYFYEMQNTAGSIAAWANCPYAEMRFWVRASADFTTTLSLMCATGSAYPHLTAQLTVKASEKWQEIRMKRSDFAGDDAFNTAVDATAGYCAIRFVTSPDFIAKGETIEMSPVSFYDGYINGEIDPSGGTIVIPDIYGELEYTLPAKVINSYNGLQTKTVPVTDNDFVSNALKLTVTDTAALYAKQQHVYTNGLESPVDLSDWNNYSKAEIRLWVKVPHAMELTLLIVESTGTAYPYISTTVNVPASGGWQELRIPRSAFTSNAEFTGEYVKFFRILTPTGSDAKGKFLDFCESMYISQVEFYSGIIPASADKVDKGAAGKLITNVDLTPTNVNGSVIGEVKVTSNSNFKSALAVQVENARTFADGEMSHYIHHDPKNTFNISAWYNNPNAEVRFWVKTDKDIELRFGFQNPYSTAQSSYKAIWGQMSLSGSDKWQEVRLSRKNFSENPLFDPTVVSTIKLIGSGDTAVTTNELFYISDVQIYDGYVNQLVDANGGTTSVSDENAIVATFSSFSTKLVSGSQAAVESVLVDTNIYFTAAARLVAGAQTSYNATLKTFYDLTDISRGKNGTIRLWVFSAEQKSFNLVLTDAAGKTVTLPFTTKASGEKWQELRVNLTDVNTAGFDFSKLFSVSVSGALGSGKTLQIGKIELWKKTLTTAVESDGGTLEPPLILPPDWDSLPTYTGKTELFAKTSTSEFWMSDWNETSRPRSVTAYNRGLDNKDENYHRFTVYKEITVVNAAVYYQNPSPAGFGFTTAVDMTPYLKTGTMRFWVKVPKNMSIQITLKSYVDGKYSESSVAVPLKVTTESGGFQEVQIPLKAFYDAAIAAGVKWNPYYIKHVLIGGVNGCDANTFLAEGETLCISQSEFWKGEALEPPPYDPTRIFYSMRGEVFIKDVNEVLAKTAMFSAYKETLLFEGYERIVNKYFTGAGLNDSYQIELISADAYNYKKVNAYDTVSVYVPVGDRNTNNLAVAVYNPTGIYPCEFTVEDGYIVFDTAEFGMILFMSGGKRNSVEFDYNDDLQNCLMLMDAENSKEISGQSGRSVWVEALIVGGILVIAAAVFAVMIILKKKGIILRKG